MRRVSYLRALALFCLAGPWSISIAATPSPSPGPEQAIALAQVLPSPPPPCDAQCLARRGVHDNRVPVYAAKRPLPGLRARPRPGKRRASQIPSGLDSVVDYMWLPGTANAKPASSVCAAGRPPKSNATPKRPRIEQRGNELFLGYRGTTEEIAEKYRASGFGNAPDNGHKAALGAGIYLTDDIRAAAEYAHMAAGTARLIGDDANPAICAIFAKDASHFREHVPKVFLPPSAWEPGMTTLWTRPQKLLEHHAQWVHAHAPGVERVAGPGGGGEKTVKLTNLSLDCPAAPDSANQMLIPAGLLQHFTVGACSVVPMSASARDSALDMGMPTLGSTKNPLDYREKMDEWHIFGRVTDTKL